MAGAAGKNASETTSGKVLRRKINVKITELSCCRPPATAGFANPRPFIPLEGSQGVRLRRRTLRC
jgi:hypothetical protein